MLRFIMSFGPMFWPQLLIVLVIVVLSLINVVRLILGRTTERGRSSINAILFWGATHALLGLLGTCFGLFNLLATIAREANQLGISPRLVATGLSECLLTTTFGLLVLFAASLAWLVLGACWRWRARSVAP